MTELQSRAINKIAEAFRIASEFYKHDFIMPTVSFKLKGRRAGYALSISNKIVFNNTMLHANGDAFIDIVPGHEAAHIIARKVYGFGIKSHGIEWRRVMRLIGLEPDRCHHFTVVTRNEYFCKCTDTIYVSTVIHNRILKGQNYSCKKCGTQVMWKKMYEKAAIFPSTIQVAPKVSATIYR